MNKLGFNHVSGDDRELILLKIIVKTDNKGKDGWFAGIKFATPLPEDISFVSGKFR
jgi:hypothetical protein